MEMPFVWLLLSYVICGIYACTDDVGNTQVIGEGEVQIIRKCGVAYQITSLQEAESVCARNGLSVASREQLTEAHTHGYAVCGCGWLSDGTAAYPMTDLVPGCGSENQINDCPATSMGVWGSAGSTGWDVYCFKTCSDSVFSSQQIKGGQVQNVHKCGQSFNIPNVQEAEIICQRNGGVLATDDQLTQAHTAGMSVCACAWQAEGKAKFPANDHDITACGAEKDVVACPPLGSGFGDDGVGWNANCFLPDPIEPADGGWSEWSSYGSCTEQCGQGIQIKTRTCTNPAPSGGGSECRGVFYQLRQCNHGACSGVSRNTGWENRIADEVCPLFVSAGPLHGFGKQIKVSNCRTICAQHGMTCACSLKVYPRPDRRLRRGEKQVHRYNGSCKTIYANTCCCVERV